MATGGRAVEQLTNYQIVSLAAAISSPNMETIAFGYMDFSDELIKSLKNEHRGNAEAFNRDIINKWASKNSGPDQVKVSYYKRTMLKMLYSYLKLQLLI